MAQFVLQALIVAVLGWVGNTVASMNREVGEMKARLEAMEKQVGRMQNREDVRDERYRDGRPR